MSVQVIASVKQVSGSASEASARTHKCLVDRPEAKGGSDRGPMGGELLLMGVGGCFMSNLLAAVKASHVDASELVVDVLATTHETTPRFARIDLVVSGRYSDRAAMLEAIAVAEKNCIAVNTVKVGLPLAIELR